MVSRFTKSPLPASCPNNTASSPSSQSIIIIASYLPMLLGACIIRERGDHYCLYYCQTQALNASCRISRSVGKLEGHHQSQERL